MKPGIFSSPYGQMSYWDNQLAATDDIETIVFLHGAALNHQLFQPQLAFFKARYRLLAVDLPMHGASRPFRWQSMRQMAHLLEQWLIERQLGAVHVVGQSMGGMVAQYWADTAPERVQSLTLIDSIPLSPRYRSRLDAWALKALPLLTKFSFQPSAIQMMARKLATTATGQQFVEQCLADLSKAELVRIMTVLVEGINTATVGEFRQPTQLLVGQFDGLAKLKAYNWACHHAENLPLHIIADAGHNANMDAPTEVNALIEAWLSKVAAVG